MVVPPLGDGRSRVVSRSVFNQKVVSTNLTVDDSKRKVPSYSLYSRFAQVDN